MERLRFNFEDLSVYQKALDFIDCVYKVTAEFPSYEKFGLASQFQRAAQSVALNIGEGSAGSKAEFQQFIRIARRSIRECIVCATIALRRKYITEKEENGLRVMADELSRMLSGLIKSIC